MEASSGNCHLASRPRLSRRQRLWRHTPGFQPAHSAANSRAIGGRSVHLRAGRSAAEDVGPIGKGCYWSSRSRESVWAISVAQT